MAGSERDELKTLRVSDYNSTMRMLHSAGRVVYVREDLIADMLKAICEEAPEYSMGFFIADVNSAYEAAEKQELSPISVLKMRYFYEKHSAKLSGEPEDRVFLKEILRSVGESEADMEKQFAEYEKDAPEKYRPCYRTNTSSICRGTAPSTSRSFAYTSICYNSQDGFQSRLFYVLTTKKEQNRSSALL